MNLTHETMVRKCVEYHNGKFPRDCFENGCIYHYGKRITIEEFQKYAKQYKQTEVNNG